MLNQSTLLDNLVTMLRSIPTLVTELGGSAYIKPIHDGNTDYSSVTEAIASIAPPGMIIWWESTSPAFVGNRMTWAHQFRAAIMPGTATPGGASRIFAAMLNGTPSAGAGRCWSWPAVP